VRNTAGVVASTHTDATGSYRVSVPAGRYTVEVDPGAMFPRCPPQEVTVSDSDVTLDVSCDSGIR
jgi:hypothetical protein